MLNNIVYFFTVLMYADFPEATSSRIWDFVRHQVDLGSVVDQNVSFSEITVLTVHAAWKTASREGEADDLWMLHSGEVVLYLHDPEYVDEDL